MENDIQYNIYNDNSYQNDDNIFQLDYQGQILKTNIKYQKWKNKMIKIYGDDAKLYRCIYDNIYFYGSNEEFHKFPFCKSQCSLCYKTICYFCSRNTENNKDFGNCCIKRKINYIILHDINNDNFEKDFYFYLLIFFVPIITLFLFIGIISEYFYYLLIKYDKNIFYYEDNDFTSKIIIINGGISLMLSIVFLVHDIYLKIIFLFVSLFYKISPLKYYLKIIKKGIEL